MPDAPIGLVDSTPPDMLTGRSPSSCGGAVLDQLPALALGSAKPRFSSHIGSNQQNGTYISTHVDLAARVGDAGLLRRRRRRSRAPARGQDGVAAGEHGRLAAHGGAVHPGGRTGGRAASAAASSASTIAQAPSDDGHVSA